MSHKLTNPDGSPMTKEQKRERKLTYYREYQKKHYNKYQCREDARQQRARDAESLKHCRIINKTCYTAYELQHERNPGRFAEKCLRVIRGKCRLTSVNKESK